ncbi:MAG: phosphatase PAP2 family protein [Alicyclobacillus sp.]|nr:phosphatase PAP2 family protein [Alicyclobacillus sp.]
MPSRLVRTAARCILRLDLYEVVGLAACIAAAAVFVSVRGRLDDIYGIQLSRCLLWDDIVGVLANREPWLFIGVFAGLAVGWTALRRSSWEHRETAAHVVRVAIGFWVLLAIYKICMFYIAVLNPFNHDAAMQSIERALFGGRLLSDWMEPIISRPLTDFLSGAYVSWFVLTYATAVLLLARGWRAMSDYVFTAIFTFYLGYFTYTLVPVMGPVFTVHYAVAVGGIDPLFSTGQAFVSRDCFPSLHTGIAVVMMVQVWRDHRRWAWFYLPVGGLIIFATLYLRFHYALDVIAGASLATVTTQLAPLMLRRWDAWRLALASTTSVRPGLGPPTETAYTELA